MQTQNNTGQLDMAFKTDITSCVGRSPWGLTEL